jgi:hypothetical protein
MVLTVHSYTIYHSPNAYFGTVVLCRGLAVIPGVVLVWRPIMPAPTQVRKPFSRLSPC